MDFDTAIQQAWADHADDAAGVAARLPALHPLVGDEAQLARVIALTRHVHGVHLGDWGGGRTALEALRSLAAYRDASSSGSALRRNLASFAICAGVTPDGLAALPLSDQIQAQALAADNLLMHDPARSAAQLRLVLDRADRSGLPDTDPMHRALAVATHNMAATLGDQAERSADERALMLLSAQASRIHWARAGTWVEVERAEYRLALSWLAAGDPAQARIHARACLDIVAANQGAALERFFGWEALGRADRAAGNAVGHAQALDQMRTAFAELSADDQGWCRESLDKLAA